MKVGVLQFFSWPGRRVPLQTVYQRALERIDVMDSSGYDAVWLAEHHFTTYSVCPSVHLMGMHIANRTRNLRIGTAVSLAAFYHPLRLAEEVAPLDVLSGGRVNWGAGRGFDRTEFTNFSIDPDESVARFREAVTIVLAAWANERLTFHGDFHDFNDVEVLPKPHQQPSIPYWVAATSPDAIAWAAAAGHSILMDPHASHGEIGRKRTLYEEGLRAAGHQVAGRDLPVARLLAVAATSSEAQAVARQGAQWTVGSYVGTKARGDAATTGIDRQENDDPVERYVNDVIIWGSPAEAIDKITDLKEQGLNYLLCAPLSHESFTLFTDKVLPVVAA